MKWFFQKNHPPVVSDYLASAKHRAKRTTEVNDHRLVVLDTETSGLDVDTDRILSIALFEMNGGQMDMARSRKWIVYQPEARPTEATTIHGILPCETREGTPEKKSSPNCSPCWPEQLLSATTLTSTPPCSTKP